LPGDVDIFCPMGTGDAVGRALNEAGFTGGDLPIQITELGGDIVVSQRIYHTGTDVPYILFYPDGNFEFRSAGDYFYEYYRFRHE